MELQFPRDNRSSGSGTFCSRPNIWPKQVNDCPNLDFTRSPVSSLGMWLIQRAKRCGTLIWVTVDQESFNIAV